MFGELFRRITWLVPLSFVVSLAAFLAFPANNLARARFPQETAEDRMVAMFDQWPLLFDASTRDVGDHTREILRAFESGDPVREAHARGELVRLGGATFPTLFDGLRASERATQQKVGLALAPVAVRMSLPRASEAADPERTVGYWEDVWAARSAEFRPANVKTALSRLRRYRTETRLDEACELDTFVLPELFAELESPRVEEDIELSRAYVEVLARVTQRDDRIGEDATLGQARETVLRWQRFWWLYEQDYRTHDGASRAKSALVDTRYAKWLSLELLEAPIQRPQLPAILARRAASTVSFVVLSTIASTALLAFARRALRTQGRPFLEHTRFVPALPLVPPVVLALGVDAVADNVNVWLAVATMTVSLTLLPRPLSSPPQLGETLHRAAAATFGIDLILDAGGLASHVRGAIGDRDAAGLTITLVLWFVISSGGGIAVRVHEALPRAASWILAGGVAACACAVLAHPLGATTSPVKPTAWFAPVTHTVLTVVAATAIGAGVTLLVLRRRRRFRGLGPLVEFAALPAVALGLLLALGGWRGLLGTLVGSCALVSALMFVHAEQIRAALHDTDLYRASLALGSDPASFAKRHLSMHARTSLAYLAILALGVTLGVEVGQRLLGASTDQTDRLAIRIGLR